MLLGTATTHLQDVFMTTGCIGAFDLAITSMAGPGDNILLPQPCFPGYNMTLGALGVEGRQYTLVVSVSRRDKRSEYDSCNPCTVTCIQLAQLQSHG